MASGSRAAFAGVAFGLALLAGGGYWLLNRTGQADTVAPAPSDKPAEAPVPPAPKAAEPVVAALPTPESAGIPKEDCIHYPDGTYLPPLNGVRKAPAVTFHKYVPFTKVVRKQFDLATGLEWYIHENGARSTTRQVWRNGVQEVYSEIDMPRASAPVADDK